MIRSFALFSYLFCMSWAYAAPLAETVQQVLNSHPDMLAAQYQKKAASEQIYQARAGFMPSVDLQAGRGYEITELRGSTEATKLHREETSIVATENIFRGMGTMSELGRTKSLYKAANYNLDQTAQTTALRTAAAYLEVLRHQQLLQAATDNLETHESITAMIERRSETGIGRKADTAQAHARLAQAKSRQLAEQQALDDSVATYMSVVDQKPTNLIKPDLPNAELMPENLEVATQTALANNPGLLSSKKQVRAARYQQKTTKASYFPEFDIVLQAARNNNIEGFRGTIRDASAMLQMRYNLFRGGSDYARDMEAAARLGEQKALRDSTYRATVETMANNWHLLKTSQQQLEYLKQHQDAAKETATAYRAQFKLGKRTLLDLLNAENEMFSVESAYITEQYQYVMAHYRILATTGDLARHFTQA